jgi:protein TonB
VKVIPGTRNTPGVAGGQRDGKPGGKPGGKGKTPGATGAAPSPAPAGPKWSPKGDLYIAQLPRTVKVPELKCPDVTSQGISGTVVLKVQVRKDGTVRSARVVDGIGGSCDKIAQKALKKAKFKPAVGTDGKSADYELRYEYVFEPPR